jgi:hypothetical protein
MSFFVEEKWVRCTEFMPGTLTLCIHLKSYAMQIYKLDLYLSREKVNTIANTDLSSEKDVDKGNNKITELRAILQRESQNSFIAI